jgi:hypothetical protein
MAGMETRDLLAFVVRESRTLFAGINLTLLSSGESLVPVYRPEPSQMGDLECSKRLELYRKSYFDDRRILETWQRLHGVAHDPKYASSEVQ